MPYRLQQASRSQTYPHTHIHTSRHQRTSPCKPSSPLPRAKPTPSQIDAPSEPSYNATTHRTEYGYFQRFVSSPLLCQASYKNVLSKPPQCDPQPHLPNPSKKQLRKNSTKPANPLHSADFFDSCSVEAMIFMRECDVEEV